MPHHPGLVVEENDMFLCLQIESQLSNKIDYDELELKTEIASGAYGTVYR